MKGTHMRLSFGLTTVYDDAEFTLGEGDKAGIVGVNGAGKTTLFRVILGEIPLDSGSVSIGRARLGYLPQEIALDDETRTVWEYLLSGRPIRRLEEELEEIYKALETAEGDAQAALLREMQRKQEALDAADPYGAEDELLALAGGMRIDPDLFGRPMRTLSGGQKSKMAFARLLFSRADVLLLDEPTNHLDETTRDFVIQYLKHYRGSVLIISHDVDFLNQIIHKIVFLNKVTHKIAVYDGNYDTYRQKYEEEKRVRALQAVHQQKEIKKLADFVQKAKQASQTNHALKRMGEERALRLEKKRKELIPQEPAYGRVKMDLRPRQEGGAVPLEADRVGFHYPQSPLLYRSLSFLLHGKERFLVVGENGVGKSTLLKLVVRILTPTRGAIVYHPKTDIAYYAQELETLDPEKTVLENVDDGTHTERELRRILANFLFRGADVYKKAAVLSPGEKARVALCQLLLRRANLLVLDEPTNHLDPDTQEILGRNFRGFDGTILAVSHNPAFAGQIGISRMLILPEGRIEPYSEALLHYYYEKNTPEEWKKKWAGWRPHHFE